MRIGFKTKTLVVMMVIVMMTALIPCSVIASGGWKKDSKGWWYEVGDSYYKSQWAQINGKWYYFDPHGYMEYDCYRDGCWLTSSGAWDPNYSHGTWKCNSTGWWYEDNGWYPAYELLKIDGNIYSFNPQGYMETDCYRSGCWFTKSGAMDPRYCHGEWKSNSTGRWYEDNGWYPQYTVMKIDGFNYWFDERGYSTYMGKYTGKVPADATKYSYELIPLLEPFNQYYFIKTDNPDPDSFRFIDTSSKYYDSASANLPVITVMKTLFSDVKYSDASKYRVNGGYIACANSSNVDGGEFMLQQQHVSRANSTYGLFYDFTDTSIKVSTKSLVSNVDYLIDAFGDPGKSYFDNLQGIQDGLSGICLYNGVDVLGDVYEAQASKTVNGKTVIGKCYYGISSSPHNDQFFYIRSPYLRLDNKPMLISYLYPFIYQSNTFPALMGAIAKKLDPGVTVVKDSYYHYLINVTHDGETRSFGGAGEGGGQGILKENIANYYKFDGSSGDALNRCSLDTLRADIKYYGTLDIDTNLDKDALNFYKVCKTIGEKGNYIRINTSNSGARSGSSYTYSVTEGYTYLYFTRDKNSQEESYVLGFFTNTWFDGRYFNYQEQFQTGVSFRDTVNSSNPSLAFKDVEVSIPGKYIDHSGMYDASSGKWKGIVRFNYSSATNSWVCTLINDVYYYDSDLKKTVYLKNDPVYGQAFTDACMITMEEALSMNLDANSNKLPDSYYVYDMSEEPGTYKHS